jgi:hypothetical protein
MSALEHAEHIGHAGHGAGHEGHDHFGTYVGITMAILGVLLAFCAAKVGGERTELVQSLVMQQHAHEKYQGLSIKHRVAFLDLQAVHALAGDLGESRHELREDLLSMAKTVDDYLEETAAADAWVGEFDPAIAAHVKAQEHFEIAQLLAEIGIVIASVALLLKKRPAWYLALALGVGALGTVGVTYQQTHAVVAAAEAKIEEREAEYHKVRAAHKSTEEENQLIAQIRKGVTAPVGPKPAAPPSPKGE